MDVVTPLADLFELGRLDVVLLGRPPGDGVEADVGDLAVVVDPRVGAVGALHQLRGAIRVGSGHMLLERVRRLDGVVIDADEDEVFGAHGVAYFT